MTFITPSPPMPSIQERVELWRRYYARSNERPLLGFFIESEYPLRRYPATHNLPEGRALRPEDFRIRDFLDDHDRLFALHEECGGDFIWSADAFWGVQWMECLCGLQMFCNHKSGNLHFQRNRSFRGVEDLPDFDEGNEWVQFAREFLTETARHSAGRYPIGTTRMRGISDMLSALYGAEEFIYAIIDDPEAVAAVCRKLTDIYIAFSNLQLSLIPDFHGGVGSFYYSNWAPAGTVWHQEDAAVMLSPALYREHIRTWNHEIVRQFAHNILHLHSVGFIPLEDYLQMGFTAVEMHIEEAGPTAEQLFDRHRVIQEHCPLLIWGDLSEQDLHWAFNQLNPRGLAINKVVHSPAQAKEIYEKFIK